MITAWQYRGRDFTQDDITEEMAGFVYRIVNRKTGVSYIGKKTLWAKTTRPPLKGKKRRRKIVKPSTWEKYFGSSKLLVEQLDIYGKEAYTREVLYIGYTRSECNYVELILQVQLDVLHTQLPNGEREYLNANIDRTYYASNTPSIHKINTIIDESMRLSHYNTT